MPDHKRKVSIEDKSVPCIVCDKEVELVYFPNSTVKDFLKSPLNNAVCCFSHGNYGSQVFDLSGTLHFALCDECVIRNSHKMLFEGGWSGPPPLDSEVELENARDHFERWWNGLLESRKAPDFPEEEREDPYFEEVGKYFEDRDEA